MTTPTNDSLTRAVIYVRVSTAAQANKDFDEEGYSIPAQRDACLRKAETLGAVVVDEYVDRGESAKSADRPQLKAMLARLQTDRDVDYVIVHKVDRLARNRADDVAIGLTIRQAGAQLVSVSENVDATPSGKLLQAIMSGIAEFYSDNLATEAIKGMTEKAKKGGTPGRAPIGYRNTSEVVDGREVRTIAVDADRAPHIQWAFQTYATGNWSMRQIADELERRGLLSVPIGKKPERPLTLSRIGKMLRDPYYIGVVTFRGVEYEGRHEPIIDRQTFAKVQQVVDDHGNGTKHRQHHHYLKGTLWCAECGSRLVFHRAHGNGGTYDYFFCVGRQRGNGCSQRYVPAEVVEDELETYYRTVQLDPEILTATRVELGSQLADARDNAAGDATRQERRIKRLTDERSKLLQAHYNDAIPVELLKSEQRRISREIEEASRLLAQSRANFDNIEETITRALELAGNCHVAYCAAGPQIRRHFNQAFFTHVWVGREGTIDGVSLTKPFRELYDRVGADLPDPRPSRKPLEHLPEASDSLYSGGGSNEVGLAPPTGFEPVPPP
jgi:DNA invertase Pin-like site-specific DNA recombinase